MTIRAKTKNKVENTTRKVRTPRTAVTATKTTAKAARKTDPVKELKTRISSLEKIVRVHEKTITKLLTAVEKLKGGPKAGPKVKVAKTKPEKESKEDKKTKKISLRKKLKKEKKDKLRRRKSED